MGYKNLITSGREISLDKIAFSFLKVSTAGMWRRMEECKVTVADIFTKCKEEISEALELSDDEKLPDRPELDLAMDRARKELEFMARHNIRGLFIGDEDYPWRLVDMPDAPVLLYSLGEYDFNSERIISIVGTRKCTAYGQSNTNRLIEDLSKMFPDLCVVSGLAYGIDAIAHTSAIKNSIPTVGVVAHGLDTIYPASHRDLARRIVRAGGSILTEYPSGTKAYRRNFLERNRIVAAISDMTVVMESAVRGGALSTAANAFSYSREVMAFPGRAGDEQSEGCNRLISKGKARLAMGAKDIIEASGWNPIAPGELIVEPTLFPEMTEEETVIYGILKKACEPLSMDLIHHHSGLPVRTVMTALSEMEFNGMVIKIPGNRYTLV